MVSIDRVYQKVLALANKEQRGYITPQEFNLFADHAQMEIFEQYFYDINQFMKIPGNNTVYSDPIDIIEDKIAAFEYWAVQDNTSVAGDYGDINLSQFTDLYRITEVRVDYRDGLGHAICEEVNLKEFRKYSESPLTRHTTKRPVFMHYRNNYDRIKVYPYPPNLNDVNNSLITEGDPVRISYTKKPTPPNWAYVVINNKPLYNATSAVDFELHASEEVELVYRILALAGVAIEKPNLTQVAGALGGAQIQQEKQ